MEPKPEKVVYKQKYLQISFLLLFSLVALGLSVPGILSESDNYLWKKLSVPPGEVRVGWRRGCMGREQCDQEPANLKSLFSTKVRDLGRGMLMLLAISSASVISVLLLALLGFSCDKWFGGTAIFLASVGALAGVTLLFVTPKFADEVDIVMRYQTRNRITVECGSQVVCEDVFSLDACGSELLKGLARSCNFALNGTVSCEMEDGRQLAGCVTSRFVSGCTQPGVVCKLVKSHAYKTNLALGLHWLVFGMFVIAIFVPMVKVTKTENIVKEEVQRA